LSADPSKPKTQNRFNNRRVFELCTHKALVGLNGAQRLNGLNGRLLTNEALKKKTRFHGRELPKVRELSVVRDPKHAILAELTGAALRFVIGTLSLFAPGRAQS
jgi:hypothetical protein